MKVSIHVGHRFLEQLMNKASYTCIDVDFAVRYLEKILKDIVPSSYARPFAISSFENYRDNTIVTIISKGASNV